VRDGLNVDDPPLTDLGHRQAELLAEHLRDRGEVFDEVYVSPLVRARLTAAPIVKALGVAHEIAPWLEEIRNPIWHGTPAEKADAAYAADRARDPHERWEGLPGGESVRDFVGRIRAGAAGFLAERGITPARDDLPVWRIEGESRRIALIAHAGTNSVTICHLLGLQPVPWEWDRFVLGHTSVTRLEALPVGGGYTFSLTRLSDVEHLPVDARTR
jgi:probable phosphoglycerate mutase